ncbi:MAG: hypothetical protein WA876_12400 [Candidatus Acidiferrales bacterium]
MTRTRKTTSKPSSKIAAVILAACLTFFVTARLHARAARAAVFTQLQSQAQSTPPASAKPSSDMSNMPGMSKTATPSAQSEVAAGPAATRAANADMSDTDMDMHMNMAHMFMTALRPPNAADQAHAAQIVAALRPAIEKYKDYKVALADGYKIFAPNVPQPIYHFTSRSNALRAQFTFDPARPTSLLYKKVGDGYQLVGAMYTAPKRFTEDQLNQRVPLSVARWHKHVNFCLAPWGTPQSQVDHTKFGFAGSISTEQACSAAGGHWIPQVFNWMVHVYPYQSDPSKIWAH